MSNSNDRVTYPAIEESYEFGSVPHAERHYDTTLVWTEHEPGGVCRRRWTATITFVARPTPDTEIMLIHHLTVYDWSRDGYKLKEFCCG